MSSYPPTALHREWAADLTPRRLYDVLRLRIDVFMIEQNCLYPELDDHDLDPRTRHFWIGSQDDAERPAAYLRVLEERDGCRIGRVCTAKDVRGKGLSRRLMEAALADVGDSVSVLDAQLPVVDLYRRFGYQVVGEEYLDYGIPHVEMRRPATP